MLDKAFYKYQDRIREHLGTDKLRVEETPFGYVVIKGNWWPPRQVDDLSLYGLGEFGGKWELLSLNGRVLHERVALIQRDVPIRSHEEEDEEVIINIGDSEFKLDIPDDPRYGAMEITIRPGEPAHSVRPPRGNKRWGFYHGFKVEEGKEGLVYVAKALFPQFVDYGYRDSFRMPENTYRGKQPGKE